MHEGSRGSREPITENEEYMAKRLILKELSRYRIDTYADIIYRNALLYGDWEAFIYGRERVTFSRYNERVNALVHALYSLGLSKGAGSVSFPGIASSAQMSTAQP